MIYNVNKLVTDLLNGLSDRQRDVLVGRFGLNDSRCLTLAKIGEKYGVTRERVRQIETSALDAVRVKFVNDNLKNLANFLTNHLNNLGGIHRESSFYQELRPIVLGDQNKVYENKINFILNATGKFNYGAEDNDFYSFWYSDKNSLETAKRFIKESAKFITSKRAALVVDGGSNSVLNQLVSSSPLSKKVAGNYLAVSKIFSANSYGDFGLSHWPEINPKTSRDWAYLVLKKENKPLHFTELTKVINKYCLNKKTNPQTVHNELIKDSRFVLLGRGTYGLKEFNLMDGTAREVIKKILHKHGSQNSKNLVQLVLANRLFKENTLLLNLQDRRHFERLNDGRYRGKRV